MRCTYSYALHQRTALPPYRTTPVPRYTLSSNPYTTSSSWEASISRPLRAPFTVSHHQSVPSPFRPAGPSTSGPPAVPPTRHRCNCSASPRSSPPTTCCTTCTTTLKAPPLGPSGPPSSTPSAPPLGKQLRVSLSTVASTGELAALRILPERVKETGAQCLIPSVSCRDVRCVVLLRVGELTFSPCAWIPTHAQPVLPRWLTQREPAAHHLAQPVACQHLQEAVVGDTDTPYALAEELVRSFPRTCLRTHSGLGLRRSSPWLCIPVSEPAV